MGKLNNAWDLYYKLVGDASVDEGLYDIYYNISKAIFKYRVNENLTQKALATKLGITQAMVSKLESGIYNYTIEQLWKIATKLGFDFDIRFQKNEVIATINGIDKQEIETGALENYNYWVA
jgi:transcriptional regulator with XRE-family HTH domain